MGSRLMHLLIADRVTEQIPIVNRSAFLAGSVAPDAVTGDEKDRSHFYEGNTNDFSKRVNLQAFFTKYRDDLPDDYLLGYYVHLIADEL
ncbi:zinc dependent phospholipase C family protein [Pseudalkalibacillus hwajinpoensis]|uniref:Phospholipase C/D domain-containing protein n=1 Tax=Guptibacillus hwajinpoensis TaxID=208199 RepID=A0A4U1ML04_9BACL|nr:zinc dependent phospholipase C family protein [Pseudalkalibacillus hwajinpoensis]TKD71381.1 hypothetical protein FBF83_00795 [Pseudalkalibacillus hwajinpoensis]